MKNFGGETLSKTHSKILCNGNPTPRDLILTCFGGVAIFNNKIMENDLDMNQNEFASDFTFLVAF